MLVTNIFSFTYNVYTLPKTNINFSFTFILSSADGFNLDWSKNLSFGKELSGSFIINNIVLLVVSIVCHQLWHCVLGGDHIFYQMLEKLGTDIYLENFLTGLENR